MSLLVDPAGLFLTKVTLGFNQAWKSFLEALVLLLQCHTCGTHSILDCGFWVFHVSVSFRLLRYCLWSCSIFTFLIWLRFRLYSLGGAVETGFLCVDLAIPKLWPLIYWSICFSNSGNKGMCCYCPADFHHLGSWGRKIIIWRPNWKAISRPCLIKRKKVTADKVVLWVLFIKPDDLSLILEHHILRTDSWVVVAYALNSQQWEVNWRPCWSSKQVLGQSKLHGRKLSQGGDMWGLPQAFWPPHV